MMGSLRGSKMISIDEDKAAVDNLAASIRFKTISYQDKEKFVSLTRSLIILLNGLPQPILSFIQVMEIDQLEHSLLFKWQGSDSNAGSDFV